MTGHLLNPRQAMPVTPVDMTVLKNLTAELGGTADQIEQRLIDTYLEQAHDWIDDLIEAAQQQDRARVALIAHTHASSSALIGALSLADLLTALDKAAKSGEVDLMPAVTEVTSEYARVAAFLRTQLVDFTDPPAAPSRAQ